MRLLGTAIPVVVILPGIGALAMFAPALHAAVIRDHFTARAFFWSGIGFAILVALLAVATSGRGTTREVRDHLAAMAGTFLVLPLMLAVPVVEAIPELRFFDAWFEMVSSLTTTGATLLEAGRVPDSVHLWRAEVAWLGGFFVWVTAIAVLAPLNLGGFEVISGVAPGNEGGGMTPITRVADTRERLGRFALQLGPVYLGLTLLLWFALYLAGDAPLTALCHAMSTLATSGITPLGPFESPGSGIYGEALILLFLVFALSRVTFTRDERIAGVRSLRHDPELGMGLFCILAVPALLFLRHWIGAIEVEEQDNFAAGLRALWGAVFTVGSFLTTAGFESLYWDSSRWWSGLETPGMVLLGLALVGGGVATTAGGVKLLRVYAFYVQGTREMERLIQPSSVAGAGQAARHMRRRGAYVAWIFFMLFAMSIAAVALILAGLGSRFDEALILAVAALSTTGPVALAAGEVPISYAALGDAAKFVLALAMVVGRLEALALIALFNPGFWRS